MALPVLTALAITAFLAIDRWTATPWFGPAPGTPIIFKIVDGATGKPLLGASFTSFEGSREESTMAAPFGVIRMFRGRPTVTGYQSLVRDTRGIDFGDMRVHVTTAGFDDFNATAAELAQRVRLTEEGANVEVIVPLRRSVTGRR
jgi:hypothetical protein